VGGARYGKLKWKAGETEKRVRNSSSGLTLQEKKRDRGGGERTQKTPSMQVQATHSKIVMSVETNDSRKEREERLMGFNEKGKGQKGNERKK